MRRATVAALLCAALAGAPHAWAASGPPPEERLLDRAPTGLVPSPESEGVTGPLDADRLSAVAPPGADPPAGADVDGYVRLWTGDGGALLAMVLVLGDDGEVSEAMEGARDRAADDAVATFDVPRLPDAVGATFADPQAPERELDVVTFGHGDALYSVTGVGLDREIVLRAVADQSRHAADAAPDVVVPARRVPVLLVALTVLAVATMLGVAAIVVVFLRRRSSTAVPSMGPGEETSP